jgi:hypothetical protein
MFEHRSAPLLPAHDFAIRVLTYAGLALSLILGSLGIGVLGYHHFAGLGWLDALLNASMILTGMGPVDPMATPGAKFFASAYALFSGVVFLTSVAFFLAPLFHRLLHRFHLDLEDDKA